MSTRTARTAWNGTLQDGSGQVELFSSGVGTFDVSWPKRTSETADGTTSPEELIAAAHSACFNMALSNVLTEGGNPPTSLDTRADVAFDPPNITGIKLIVTGVVPGITAEQFQAAAEDARQNCPVSKVITGTTIELEASLAS